MTPAADTGTLRTGRTDRPTIDKNAASGHFSAVDLTAGEVVADLGEG